MSILSEAFHSVRGEQLFPAVERPTALSLSSRYSAVSKNDIDFFVCPEEQIAPEDVVRRVTDVQLRPDAALTLYVHTPFCAESCVFCAFARANHKAMKQIPEYVDLVLSQIRARFEKNEALKWHPITAIHFGGGSPDLLGPSIEKILHEFLAMPGYRPGETEISVEASPATVKKDFIDTLVDYGVTKVSFGIQTFDRTVAKSQKIVKGPAQLDRVLQAIDDRIPFVNVDLMTGLPGQTVETVEDDIVRLMEDPRVSLITTYSTSYNNSPKLIADVLTGKLPPEPAADQHILMRYLSLNLLYRYGWVRRGTHTYARGTLPAATIARIKGNESVARRRQRDALVAFGPSSVTSIPGLRLRQVNDLNTWSRMVANGQEPLDLRSCSLEQLADLALWIFPLRFEGLSVEDYKELIRDNVVTDEQHEMLQQLVSEGLVVRFKDVYRTSVIGEVFMGCLMQDLRQPRIREAVDRYVQEGEREGERLAQLAGQVA